jgi:hypothetical protein
MLQEDLSLASAWHGNVRPGFSPDEAYQGHAAFERKKISPKVALRIKHKLFPGHCSMDVLGLRKIGREYNRGISVQDKHILIEKKRRQCEACISNSRYASGGPKPGFGLAWECAARVQSG